MLRDPFPVAGNAFLESGLDQLADVAPDDGELLACALQAQPLGRDLVGKDFDVLGTSKQRRQ
jgi:hypothetical protein